MVVIINCTNMNPCGGENTSFFRDVPENKHILMRVCIGSTLFVTDLFLLWLGKNVNEGDLNLFLKTEKYITQNIIGHSNWGFSRNNNKLMKFFMINNLNRIRCINYILPEKGESEVIESYELQKLHLNILPSTKK